MARIDATLDNQDMLCIDAAAGPCGLVVFGASGDLAHRKLYSSLFELYRRDLMSHRFYLLGCGRSRISDEQFRQTVEHSLRQTSKNADLRKVSDFISRFHFLSGDYSEAVLYQQLCERLTTLDEQFDVSGARIFYLSVPPILYESIAEKLGELKLNCRRFPAVFSKFGWLRKPLTRSRSARTGYQAATDISTNPRYMN
jgi:glucose-6-phosphate 1-dehydrogenase